MAKTTTIKTETPIKVEKTPVGGSLSSGDGSETPIDTVIAILEEKQEPEIAPPPKKPLLSGGIRRPLLSGSKPLLSGSSSSSSTTTSSAAPTSSLLKKPLHSPSLAKPVVDENKTASLMTSLFCFEVMWCKQSKKKHKVYSDGFLLVEGQKCTLKDPEGKEIGKTNSYSKSALATLKEGESLTFSSKEVEIVKPRSIEDYLSGRIFQVQSKSDTSMVTNMRSKGFSKFKSHVNPADAKPAKIASLFNPDAPNAVVLYHAKGPTDEFGKPHVSVVVDPAIAKHLRPHQVEGIKFLFNCVTGKSTPGYCGCILADAMGLGKTLQSIALMYTLLKQGINGSPLVRKALIICPSSLVSNWKKEIKMWLGIRVRVLDICGDSPASQIVSKLQAFKIGSMNQIMIASYGYFRKYVDKLAECAVDLIICDEGHTLKNSSSKVTGSLHVMPTKRRILVTGTPIQNNLEEFFVLVDIVNPGLLGSLPSFKTIYEKSILMSKEKNCPEIKRMEGELRAQELNRKTSVFILRRQSDILQQYLPPKSEQVVFCRLSHLQQVVYQQLLRSRMIEAAMESSAYALECIQALQKLCNHPALVYDKCANASDDRFRTALSLFPSHFSTSESQPEFSVKFMFVKSLIEETKANGEKIVLVSNYTQTLDMLEHLCTSNGFPFLRLDGSTKVAKRQESVDQFNEKNSKAFVFLLSSKAGGVGLNLIGANRLVLFEPAWNPATDKQAMARIWRERQTKHVYIYRLLSTGTIEEKIYQRQISKESLSTSVVDDHGSESADSFSSADLKKLFELRPDSPCETHDFLSCHCEDEIEEVDGVPKLKEVDGWYHHRDDSFITDLTLKKIHQQLEGRLTFVFENQTLPKEFDPTRVESLPCDDVPLEDDAFLDEDPLADPEAQSLDSNGSRSSSPASSSSSMPTPSPFDFDDDEDFKA